MTGEFLPAKADVVDCAASYCCENSCHALKLYHPSDHDYFVDNVGLAGKEMEVCSGVECIFLFDLCSFGEGVRDDLRRLGLREAGASRGVTRCLVSRRETLCGNSRRGDRECLDLLWRGGGVLVLSRVRCGGI